MSTEQKLNIIVQRERRILKDLIVENGLSYDLSKDNLRGDCIDSANRVEIDCGSKGFSAKRIHTMKFLKISKQLDHYFSLIKADGKYFIIDCTYRQFFSKTNNEPKDDNSFRDPGMYMIANDERKKVAEQILIKGWIEATPENLKYYLDGFIMADRKSFDETGISYEEYVKMLVSSQRNIEELDEYLDR